MPKIALGFHYDGMLGTSGYPGPAEFARHIEELGLDAFWCGESPCDRGFALDQFAVLCYASAATSRIRIGSSILLMPLHHPGWVAKRFGTLDRLSGGRLVLGIGTGGEYPKQFDLFEVDQTTRGRRTDDGLRALRVLWREEEASYDGEFYHFEGIRMVPRPLQQPHPPVWIGGRAGGVTFDADGERCFKSKTAAMKRAGRLGDGWIPYYMTVDGYRSSVESVKQHAADAGRDPDSLSWAYVTNIFIRASYDEALRDAQDMRRYGRDLSSKVADYDLIGSTRDIVDRLGAYAEAGMQHVVLHVQSRPGELMNDIERISRDIAPHF